MRTRLAIGALGGLVWGVAAAAVFLAMFRGDLPVPGQVGLPVAIGLVLLYLPFIVAAGAEAAAGRGSAPFPEIIGATIGAGTGLGLLVTAGFAFARRLARDWQKRG